MNKNNGHQQNDVLQNFLSNFVTRIGRVNRWMRYGPSNKQTVLEHTLETALLTQIVIALEEEFGSLIFDNYLLLSTSVNHDLGEGIIGDVAYNIKNDVRVKEMLELIEKEEFSKAFDALDEKIRETVKNHFLRSFSVQEGADTLEGKLFNAIEKIGYVIFALREISAGNFIFIRVLKNHHESLLSYGDKFVSIKMLYDECLTQMGNIPTGQLLQHDFVIAH